MRDIYNNPSLCSHNDIIEDGVRICLRCSRKVIIKNGIRFFYSKDGDHYFTLKYNKGKKQ